MRKVFHAALVFAFVMGAHSVFAGKIGFLDSERAVLQVKEGQAKLKELEAWIQQRRQNLEQAAAKVNELREKLKAQQSVASQGTIEALQREELAARRVLEDLQRAFDRDVEQKQQEFLGEIGRKIGTVASDFGKANGYDAIFILNAQPLVYISESTDLTDTVIELYDRRFGS
ncbi:MAG: OmpH family outer membrane protein [Thermoanaerobaculales bacterium]|nr:OmpH family outer membrane protein [Thermoanaerobaculales bacterium]